MTINKTESTNDQTRSTKDQISPTGKVGGTFGRNDNLDDIQRSSWGHKEKYEPLEKQRNDIRPNKRIK